MGHTCICRHGASAGRTVQVFQTLNGCVICFDTVPKACIKRFIQIRDATETFTKTRVAVALSPQSASDDAPWTNTKSITHAVADGKGTLSEGALSVTQTAQTHWNLPLTPQTLELRKNGNIGENAKTDFPRLPCLSCGQENSMRRKRKGT